MMAYRDSYAACILLDGKVLPEKDGAVVLPFGSEYKIRLRNKSRVRSVADVCVDGVTAVKGVVVDADTHVDLERYLDGDLNKGSRFQLARLSDGRVEQPGDSQNGLVEIRFYQEKPAPKVETVIHEHHDHHHHHNHGHWPCHDPWCPICHPKHPWVSPVWGGTYSNIRGCSSDSEMLIGSSGAEGETLCYCSSPVKESISSGKITRGVPEAAATVHGSQSSQQFTSVSVDIDESTCVTLSLKLMGVSQVVDQCPCGRKRKKESFCPDCGKKLVS